MNLFSLSLQTVKIDFELQIEALEQFLLDINHFATGKKQQLEQKVSELAKRSDEPDEIYEWYSDEYNRYNSGYLIIANSSTLVMVCALYESFLKDFALHVGQFINGADAAAVKKVMYASDYKAYISENTKLDFSELEELEKQIFPLVILRNKLIHYSTNLMVHNLSLENIRDYDILKAIPHLMIDKKNGEYYIDDMILVLDFITNIKAYFNGYYNLLKSVDLELTKRR
jgi:hypothetical protein